MYSLVYPLLVLSLDLFQLRSIHATFSSFLPLASVLRSACRLQSNGWRGESSNSRSSRVDKRHKYKCISTASLMKINGPTRRLICLWLMNKSLNNCWWDAFVFLFSGFCATMKGRGHRKRERERASCTRGWSVQHDATIISFTSECEIVYSIWQ